jgi:hypothetical protein
MEDNMNNCITPKQNMLQDTLNLLWLEHVYWTRLAIQGIVFGTPDTDATLQRLLRNPVDFANALRPFFGSNIANRFKELFTEHLTIAAELVKAAAAGDTIRAEAERRKWYRNANEIALFLSQINPFWSRSRWQSMLFEHLRLTENEAGQLIGGNYQASIATFDNIQSQALMMADYMFMGLINCAKK